VEFRRKLLECSNFVKAQKGKVDKKTEILRDVIKAGGKFDLTSLPDMPPMPSDPRVKCIGIVPEKCTVFKSAVQPMRLTFECEIEETVYEDEEETKETEA